MNEFELKQTIKSLPREITPADDLWPGIEARLEPRTKMQSSPVRQHNWRLPAIAAALVIALTSGIFIGRGLDTSTPGALSTKDYVIAGSSRNAEREFQAAFQELIPLDYSGMQLAGNNPDALRVSWNEMQKTESLLLAALKDYPSNSFLNEKLIDLRSQQLQFVKQLVLLEQNNWRRT
jgi:hypothetical protein